MIEGDVAIELQANLGLSIPQIWANFCLLESFFNLFICFKKKKIH